MIFIYPSSHEILISLASLAGVSFNIQHCKRREEENDMDKNKGKTIRYFQIPEVKEEPEHKQWQWEKRGMKGLEKYLEDGLHGMDEKDMSLEWFLDVPFGWQKDGATFHWREKYRRKYQLVFSRGRWGEHRWCPRFYLSSAWGTCMTSDGEALKTPWWAHGNLSPLRLFLSGLNKSGYIWHDLPILQVTWGGE